MSGGGRCDVGKRVLCFVTICTFERAGLMQLYINKKEISEAEIYFGYPQNHVPKMVLTKYVEKEFPMLIRTF